MTTPASESKPRVLAVGVHVPARGQAPAPPADLPARDSLALAARADELHGALARLLDTRDAYLQALGANPVLEQALAEEVDYLSAIRAARRILEGPP